MKRLEITTLSETRQALDLKAPLGTIFRGMESEELGELTLSELSLYAKAIGARLRVYLEKP